MPTSSEISPIGKMMQKSTGFYIIYSVKCCSPNGGWCWRQWVNEDWLWGREAEQKLWAFILRVYKNCSHHHFWPCCCHYPNYLRHRNCLLCLYHLWADKIGQKNGIYSGNRLLILISLPQAAQASRPPHVLFLSAWTRSKDV